MPDSTLSTVREQLAVYGDGELADEDLLALVIGAGAGRSARDVARTLLASVGDVRTLATAMPAELTAVPGVGPALAARIVASLALAARVLGRRKVGAPLRGPADIHAALAPRIGRLDQEVFIVLGLDVRNCIKLDLEIARGHLTGVEVAPREVFRPLVRAGCASVAVAHNHPSGVPTPSADDVALTRRLRDVGEIVGIPLVDHVIVCAADFVSLSEQRLL